MKNQSLIFSLYDIGAIQFGEFKLKSGKTSTVYVNLRKIISYPNILRAVADAMWEKVTGCQFDLVCGVPYTALPIATCLSLDHNVPMIMRRKEKKDYGTKQLIEGEFKAGQRCLIIEDVVTTGGSILETTQDLEAAHLKITDIIALIDREQGGNENLSQNYRFHAIFTITEVLDTLLKSGRLNDSECQAIKQFLLERTA